MSSDVQNGKHVIGVVALAIPHWFANDDGFAGLFVRCENGMRCNSATNDLSPLLLNAVRGLLIASSGVNLLAIITSVSGKIKKNSVCQRVGAGILIFAGMVAIAGLVVFTVYFEQLSEGLFIGDEIMKGYCYAIAWVAAGLCIVFGTLGLISIHKYQSQTV